MAEFRKVSWAMGGKPIIELSRKLLRSVSLEFPIVPFDRELVWDHDQVPMLEERLIAAGLRRT